MKSLLAYLAASAAIVLLSGCGSLNTVRYHAPSIESEGIPLKSTTNGIAFSLGAICFHVSEAHVNDVQVRAMTLVGIPVFPLSLSTDELPQVDHFDVGLWLVPQLGDTTYSFDVREVELEYDDGSRVRPSTVQVSRFRTRFVERGYWLTTGKSEGVKQTDHWDAKRPSDFSEPLELWEWNRVNMSFSKPVTSLNPVKFYVFGVLRNGSAQDIPVVRFQSVSEVRQAFPGRYADGSSIGDWPSKTCRALQKEDQPSANVSSH